MKRCLFTVVALALGFTLQLSAEAQGIRYLFSSKVEQAVDSVLAHVSKDRTYGDYFLVLHMGQETHSIIIHEIDPDNPQIAYYVSESNRYIELGEQKITIVIDSDLRYGVWENAKGNLIRMQLLDGVAEVKFDTLGRLRH